MFDYQTQKQYENERKETAVHTFAQVGTVYSDGVTLIFAGQTAESTKHYPANKDVAFSAGDKVLLFKASGTYVVVCRI